MSRRTRVAVDATVAGGMPIEDLITAAADLKGELIQFAQRPRFATQLTTLLVAAADRHRQLDEVRAVLTLDRFALQHRLSDGRTVVEHRLMPAAGGNRSRWTLNSGPFQRRADPGDRAAPSPHPGRPRGRTCPRQRHRCR